MVTPLIGIVAVLIVTTCVMRGDRPGHLDDQPRYPAGVAPSLRAGAGAGAGATCPEPASDGPPDTAPDRGVTRFAVIGDYGASTAGEAQVARLVAGWRPDFVITTGDNNYDSGAAETIDANIGRFYHQFISPYMGSYGCAADRNRFFPSLGNHDLYTEGGKPYLDYFTLPGNERYYDVVWDDVHLFALDSDPTEPDGIMAESTQAAWLRDRLAASTARFRVVYMHHPPYSAGPHQSSLDLRWPFKAWGASVVFSGHDHDYERLEVDGLTYVVNGLGGAERYAIGEPLPESVVQYDQSFGAVVADTSNDGLRLRFYTVEGRLIDDALVLAPPATAP